MEVSCPSSSYLILSSYQCYHHRSVLLASACPSVLIFAEDWTRKLGHISNFLRVKAIYSELLQETEEVTCYSLSGEEPVIINHLS